MVTRETPIIVAVLLAACATSGPGPNATKQARRSATDAPQNMQRASANQSASVRTNGVYLRRYAKHPATFTYLRFYDDGTVISVTAKGEPRHLLKWFDREGGHTRTGQYRVRGSSIEFMLHPSRQADLRTSSFSMGPEARPYRNRGVILDGGAALNLSAPGPECRRSEFFEAETLKRIDLEQVLERLDAVPRPGPGACSRPNLRQKRP